MRGGRAWCERKRKTPPASERPSHSIAAARDKMGIAKVPLCQHWMDNATRCGSPAMRGTRFCYSHHRAQVRGVRKTSERARQRWFESVALEDAASVQRALRQVLTRLLSDDIGHQKAGQILYTLQTATIHLRGAKPDPRKNK
jgi:hypothetical protein